MDDRVVCALVHRHPPLLRAQQIPSPAAAQIAGVSMEVIGAGWGRTGTSSLKAALDMLGLHCYHMREVFTRPADAEQWLRAARGEPVDWGTLLHDYQACVDWPSTAVYQQLMQAYPDAKVLLSVRDPDKWLESTRATIWRARKTAMAMPWYVAALLRLLSPRFRWFSQTFRDMLDATVWCGPNGLQGCDLDAEPERAKALFLCHIEAVKQAVPADRLLVFEVKQGWGPLCAFLGKPVPGTPFPHVNDTAEFNAGIAASQRRTMLLALGAPAVAAAALACGVALVVRARR